MNELAALRQVLPAAASETDALPHNIEAEQQLLGAILTNNEVYDRIASLVKPEHFFDPVHQRIFERAAARIQKNALASPVTMKPFFDDDAAVRVLRQRSRGTLASESMPSISRCYRASAPA